MRVILLIMIGFSLVVAKSVVVDKSTGLMWQDNAAAKSVKRDFAGAKSYCSELVLSGYDDWFLPTHEQLQTITDKRRYNPAMKSIFKNVISSDYWSSSPNVSTSYNAWYVYFKGGNSYYDSKTFKYYVRCARAGQSDTSDFVKILSSVTKQELSKIPKPLKMISLKRGEFETTAEFNTRVAAAKVKHRAIVAEYKKGYGVKKAQAQKVALQKTVEIVWGKPLLSNLKYDADNGYFKAKLTFDVKRKFKRDVIIKIERNIAREFKSSFNDLTPKAVFEYKHKKLRFKYVLVKFQGQVYIPELVKKR